MQNIKYAKIFSKLEKFIQNNPEIGFQRNQLGLAQRMQLLLIKIKINGFTFTSQKSGRYGKSF